MITKHQKFLKVIDQKERENNVVVLGVPYEHEALDGAMSDEVKLVKIWDLSVNDM